MTSLVLKKEESKWQVVVAFVLFFLILFGSLYIVLSSWQFHSDWTQVYHKAAQVPFSPYVSGFLNAPWLAFLLHPFSYFSWQVGQALWLAISFSIITWYVYTENGNPLSVFLIITSIIGIQYIVTGQVDALVLVGYIMLKRNVQFSSLLLITKPQVAAMALLGDKVNWRVHLAELAFGLLVSFAVWGAWPVEMWYNIQSDLITSGNISLFPYTIPLGIYLGYLSYKKDNIMYGALATICFTPYLLIHSLLVHITILAPKINIKWQVVAYILSWAVYLLSLGG